jgi:uncharacterized membrane protein (UPF0182 family)
MVLSDDITTESRVLFNRKIGDRVRAIAPFLEFDQDPYLVLAEGRLYWIYDAYTTSSRYPYSAPVNGRVNYIRNAVKFVIDANDGTTTAYLADARDPIAAAYNRRVLRDVRADGPYARRHPRARALPGGHLRAPRPGCSPPTT